MHYPPALRALTILWRPYPTILWLWLTAETFEAENTV